MCDDLNSERSCGTITFAPRVAARLDVGSTASGWTCSGNSRAEQLPTIETDERQVKGLNNGTDCVLLHDTTKPGHSRTRT